MKSSRGYALLLLIMIITMMTLGSSVAVIQQDTRLKRYTEQELKLNLDAIRRATELFNRDVETGKIPAGAAVIAEMTSATDALTGNINSATAILAKNGYLRQSSLKLLGETTMASFSWNFRYNLLKNSSFEDDDASISTDLYINSVAVASDGIPDYWKVDKASASQIIYSDKFSSAPATYVMSFWGRWCTLVGATSTFVLSVIRQSDQVVMASIATGSTTWKRHFTKFALPAPATLAVRLGLAANASEAAIFDGLMLEKWEAPPDQPGMEPFPSAWAKDVTFVSSFSTEALQQTQVFGIASAPANWVHRLLEW